MLSFDPWFGSRDRLDTQARRHSPAIMAFDAVRGHDEVFVYFDVPGVSADAVDVSVERNELTVSADRRWDHDPEQSVLAQERPEGSFTRRLVISDALDTEALEASLADGVLTIRIPVAEQSKPRRVKVAHESGRSAIEASAQEKDAPTKKKDAG
jgi:HSP20 family protein